MRTPIPAFMSRILAATAPASAPGGKSWLFAPLVFMLTHFTYIALAGVLIVASIGVPIPEDIPLVFSGYLCNKEYSPIKDLTVMIDTDHDGIPDTIVHRRVPKPYFMMIAGIAGVLIGDTIVFNIGRHGIESNNFAARHLRKVMHTKRREWVERHFAKHGNLTVFVGRFMPGARSIVFAMAGLAKMSYGRFLLIDGMAAAISVPFFIWLGYHFAWNISWLFERIERIKHIVIPIAVVLVAGALVLYYLRRRRTAAVIQNV